MYMELTEAETNSMQKELLMNALHWFEFPRVDIYDFNEDLEEYNILLSNEEINIISTYMVVEWFASLPFASVEHTLSPTMIAIYYAVFVVVTLILWSRKAMRAQRAFTLSELEK